MNLYLCGGAGTNIGKKITDNIDLNLTFIDSSLSNLKDVDPGLCYIIDDMDGAGKHRATTYDKFKTVADEVLIRFKPSDELNVVVSSLSGGTGSVTAPMLVKELLTQGRNVVVIGIDSRNSVIEIENTIKTLKTYKGVSSATGKSIALYFVENKSRKEADSTAILFTSLMELLINKSATEEFDTSDLSNFINFDRVTANSPDVGVLLIGENETITPEKGTAVVSTILVTKSQESSIKPVIPEYLATCVVTDKHYNNADIRIDNVIGQLGHILDDLEKQVSALHDTRKVNKVKEVSVNSNSDGMVL